MDDPTVQPPQQKKQKVETSALLCCSKCQEQKDRTEFSKSQLKKKTTAKCRSCIDAQQVQQSKKPPQERRCANCGESKRKNYFSDRQWKEAAAAVLIPVASLENKEPPAEDKTSVGRCLTCYPVEEESTAIRQENEEREAREKKEQRNQIRKDFLEQKARGIAYYEFPGWDWDMNAEGGPAFKALPQGNDLAGEYEILYHAHEADDFLLQRTTKRMLTLSIKDDGRLHGSAQQLDKSMTLGVDGYVPIFEDKFVFEEKDDRLETLVRCKVTDFPFQFVGDEEDVTVSLKVLGQRVAGSWIPTETYHPNDEDLVLDAFAQPRFANTQEAEDAVRRATADAKVNKNFWLCKHLPVPPEVAPVIHQFVACKPCPAVFFEEGDLCLKVQWDNSEQTYFIARKRKNL